MTADSTTNDDLVMAVQALEQLKKGSPGAVTASSTGNSSPSQDTRHSQSQLQPDSFLEKVTSHPLISNSLHYMLEKTISQANSNIGEDTATKKRAFDNEETSFKRPKLTPSSTNLHKILPPLRGGPSAGDVNDLVAAQRKTLLDIKELGMMNLSIESRKKLTMLINFLKIGNKQLSSRIDSLIELCDRQQPKDEDEFVDAKSQISRTASMDSLTAINSTDEVNSSSLVKEESQVVTQTAEESSGDSTSNSSPAAAASNTPSASATDDLFLQQLKQEIVGTVKKIVNVVSKFSGNSLPEPARSNVREVLLKLPINWATAINQDGPEEDQQAQQQRQEHRKSILSNLYSKYMQKKPDPNERVLILAQESLDMIQKVMKFCNDSLDKAENWNLAKQTQQQTKLLNKLETMTTVSSLQSSHHSQPNSEEASEEKTEQA
ncbi:unnamed protein product [Kuraishia capsulata CBS 1993]|uniref:Uncharacterized protein n=1 Tax=Kuraishia capsulata CBS 1993 TaxID=1382522 RepID=W6MGV5_9ASCO|nr:uncharacterized protein KUCA_T00000810001 [Kuraishia capsulata CBS 1993]CDK24843.1 unnamed protein product [Kuraishia capsulata CBS 1993]